MATDFNERFMAVVTWGKSKHWHTCAIVCRTLCISSSPLIRSSVLITAAVRSIYGNLLTTISLEFSFTFKDVSQFFPRPCTWNPFKVIKYNFKYFVPMMTKLIKYFNSKITRWHKKCLGYEIYPFQSVWRVKLVMAAWSQRDHRHSLFLKDRLGQYSVPFGVKRKFFKFWWLKFSQKSVLHLCKLIASFYS